MNRSTLIGGVAAGLLLTTTLASPAYAGPVEVIPWEDSYETVHLVGEEEWCDPDVVDFEVAESWEGSGIDRVTTEEDGILRFASVYKSVATYTANGKTFVVEAQGNGRDHEIVDNGDGTLTIWVKESFKSTVWLDGEFLFHDSGINSGAILVDYNGTLSDPDDDVFLGVAEDFVAHGRVDTLDRDFCEDIALYLGD